VNDDDRKDFFLLIIFVWTCFCSPVSRIFQVVYGMSWYGMSWYDMSWYDMSWNCMSWYDVSLMDVSFGLLLLLLFSSSFLPLVFMLQEKKEKSYLFSYLSTLCSGLTLAAKNCVRQAYFYKELALKNSQHP
jgi:hypothetical protein